MLLGLVAPAYLIYFVVMRILVSLQVARVTAVPLIAVLAYSWYALRGAAGGHIAAVLLMIPTIGATFGLVGGLLGALASVICKRLGVQQYSAYATVILFVASAAGAAWALNQKPSFFF